MTSPESLLEEALVLTQKMLALAEADEWEQVKALEEKQEGLLRTCFKPENRFADRASVAEKAQEILDLNQQIIEASAQSKARINQDLSQMQKGRAAIRAYMDNS